MARAFFIILDGVFSLSFFDLKKGEKITSEMYEVGNMIDMSNSRGEMVFGLASELFRPVEREINEMLSVLSGGSKIARCIFYENGLLAERLVGDLYSLQKKYYNLVLKGSWFYPAYQKNEGTACVKLLWELGLRPY